MSGRVNVVCSSARPERFIAAARVSGHLSSLRPVVELCRHDVIEHGLVDGSHDRKWNYFYLLEFWVTTAPLIIAPAEGLGWTGPLTPSNVFHTFIHFLSPPM